MSDTARHNLHVHTGLGTRQQARVCSWVVAVFLIAPIGGAVPGSASDHLGGHTGNAPGIASVTASERGGHRDYLPIAMKGHRVFQVTRPAVVGQIGGTVRAVAVQDGYAYFGMGPRVVVARVSAPDGVEVVGRSDVLPGTIEDIVVEHDIAYAAGSWTGGLMLLDMHDPQAPELVRWVPAAPGPALGVDVEDGLAFLANGFWGGLQVFGVRDPARPVLLGGAWSGMIVTDVAVADGFAYVAATEAFGAGEGTGWLTVYDAHSPESLSLVAGVSFPSPAVDVSLDGDWALVSTENDGLWMIDITVPDYPLVRGKATDIAAEAASAADGVAFVAGEGLRALDVREPEKPTVVGTIDTPAHGLDVALIGSTALVAGGEDGLVAVDVGQLESLRIADAVETVGSVRTVSVRDGDAVIGTASGILHVIDVTDPSAAEQRGVVDLSAPIQGIDVRRGHAFVAASTAGLLVVDIAGPSAPEVIARARIPGAEARDVRTVRDIVIVAAGRAGLRAYGVANPAGPRLLGSLPIGEDVGGVEVAGYRAFASADGLHVIDVWDPSRMLLLGSVRIPYSRGISVQGDRALVTSAGGGTAIIDVRDPSEMQVMGMADCAGRAWDVAVYGRGALVTSLEGGVQVLDVSDAWHPTEVAVVDMPAYAVEVHVEGRHAYVATEDAGLMILALDAPVGEPALGRRPAEVDRRGAGVAGQTRPGNTAAARFRIDLCGPAGAAARPHRTVAVPRHGP